MSPRLCKCCALRKVLTIHDSPASQVTLELIGQRLIRCGKVSNGHKPVVIHRLGQFDDGNVISAQIGQVEHCDAEAESNCCTVTLPQTEFPVPAGMDGDALHANVLLTALLLKQVVLAHHDTVRTGMTDKGERDQK